MDRAKIGLFDDQKTIRDALRDGLEDAGHSIELEADTLAAARDEIAMLDPSTLDVAVVDGNLTKRDISGSDGAEITALLHGLGGITVIGFSASAPVEGADHNVFKDEGITPILDIISGL